MQSTSQRIEPKDIKVKVLLTGGHEYTVYLKSDTPILHSLLTSIVAGSMSPSQLSNNTHAVAKVLDKKYQTIGEGSSKKENVLIMTPEEITEIKGVADSSMNQ